MSDLPKMMSKREIELEELEEAKYVQSLRDDIEKFQEQLDTAKKALKEIFGIAASHDDEPVMPSITDISNAALAAIGGDDDSI